MTKSLPSTRHSLLISLLLAITLLAGGALRFYNLRWDLGTFPHPDERSTLLFYAPTIRPPQTGVSWLDPRRSPLNPFWNVQTQERRSYTYGHFPLYLLVATGDWLAQLAPTLQTLHAPPGVVDWFSRAETGMGYAVVGRGLVALFDTLSLYLIFLIARRMYGPWAGLLAAALSAFAVQQIQLAHFFAVDPVSTTFVLWTVYGSLVMLDRQTIGPAVWTGAAVGLAVSSKYSALPVALAPAVAAWFIWRRPPAGRPADPPAGFNAAINLLAAAAAASFLTFALTSPFVLLDFDNFRQAVLVEQGNMVSGVADFPFTRQYRFTAPYLYFIEQQLRWGLGWPLGLPALAGSVWALARAVRGRLSPGGWIILAWLVPYFGLTGLFLAKFNRYMSPVIPFAVIFGAGLLAALGRRYSRRLAAGLAGAALLGAAMWAAMFVNGVYAAEHSWVSASRWIYANIPDGSCIAVEHWEESLPRDWAWLEPGMSPGAHAYAQPQLPMYNPDTEQKFQTIRDTLKHCDYLVLASNRMWRTLPRLSPRYPMSTGYYRALFGGELGYTVAAEFATPPRLGPWVIDDQPADESFTVYDHPRAIIFKKTRDLSDEEWFRALGNTWQGAVHNYVGRPTLLMRLRGAGDVPRLQRDSPGAAVKSTALKTPLNEWPVVNDWQWNEAVARHSTLAALVWWLAIEVIGLAAFPVAFLLLRRLSGGGWLMSKSLGLLLVSYGVWLPAGLGLPANRLEVAVAALAIVAVAGWGAALRRRPALKTWWRERKWFVLAGEGVFAAVFALFVGFRMANPDLWQPWNGGEKMLEIGFLHAIVKSAAMPPYDPFFAGTFINYYYYGLFVVGVLVKLTGITPTVAFNLAVPMLAALTAANLFSLGGSLARLRGGGRAPAGRAIGAGLLAVVVVLFFSNLDGMGQFLRDLAEISGSGFTSAVPGLQTLVRGIIGFGGALGGVPVPEYNFWDPSRVIPNTINEFPYWSFLFADLHPHMIGIPFTVLFLGLLYAWLGRVTSGELQVAPRRVKAGYWVALAFVLGAIAIINTWDLPTYLGLAVAAFAVSRYRAARGPLTLSGATALALKTAGFGAVVLAAALLMYRPFFAHYRALDVGLGVVKDKISLDQFFKLWGFFLLVILSWLWLELRHPRDRLAPLRALGLFARRWNTLPHLTELYRGLVTASGGGYRLALGGMALLLVAALLLAVAQFYTLAFLLPWAGVALLLLLRRKTSAGQAFVELLAFTGLLLLVGVQLVFLKDFLGGGDYYRMNTYFKFFIQVWVLFGLAAAAMLAALWRSMGRWRWRRQLAWSVTVVVLAFSSLIFGVLGTRTRLDNRFPGNRPAEKTLDGMAYMTVGQFDWDGVTYTLRDDYEALKWLQANVTGTPIIAEAKMGYYREWGMRVAAYTGLPSILGGLHQSEQHFPEELGRRDGLVNQFWFAADETQTLALIEQLGIEYIYLGQLERALYGPGPQARFDSLARRGALEVVFQNQRTVIYRVVHPR